MVITFLKKYEIIDVNDEVPFKDHTELSDLCFGMHGNPVRAEYPINEKCRYWMPKFGKNGSKKKASSGWVNEIRDGGNIIITTAPQSDPTNSHHPQDFITLIYAKEGANRFYTFKGAYVEDQEESTDTLFFFRRVATRVRLIGNPVSEIELMNEDRSAFGGSERKRIEERTNKAIEIENAIIRIYKNTFFVYV